jgi:hypothetical protein
MSVTKKQFTEVSHKLSKERGDCAEFKLASETADQTIKVDTKSLEATRRELGNKLKALRLATTENERLSR